jgi:hypothetical protein
VFKRQNEPAAQGLLPTGWAEVLKELLAAPTWKALFFGGLVIVLIGAALSGVDVFSSSSGT